MIKATLNLINHFQKNRCVFLLAAGVMLKKFHMRSLNHMKKTGMERLFEY